MQAAEPDAQPITWNPAPLREAMTPTDQQPRTLYALAMVWHAGDTRLEESFPKEWSGQLDNGELSYTLDTIFHLRDLATPIVCAAAMTFIDQGRLGLNDPVAYWLPEFADVQVGVFSEEGEFLRMRRPAREIRIGDLMTQTAGLPERWSGNKPERRSYPSDTTLSHANPTSLRALVREIATMPLAYDPGSAWSKGCSTEVLAAVLEEVEGRPIDEVMHERIFAPLEMQDSGRVLPIEKRERLPKRFVTTTLGSNQSVRIELPFLVLDSTDWSYGLRLYSTLEDYLNFCVMLAGMGEHDGVRVLSAESVRAMLIDQIAGKRQAFGSEVAGYGLGLAQLPDADGQHAWGWNNDVPGSSWRRFYPSFFLDPARQLIAVSFCHHENFAPLRRGVSAGLSSTGEH